MIITDGQIQTWAQIRKRWKVDPVLYCRFRIGLDPTAHQVQLLRAIAQPDAKVTVRSCHGAGKTSAVAVAILWFLECFSYSKVGCTAPTSNQLRDVIWSELANLIRMSDGISATRHLPEGLYLSRLFKLTQDKLVAVGAERQWFAVARTSRKEAPEALQGIHAKNLMFVVDEASGVPDEIFEVALGTLTSRGSRFVMVGNPNNTSGFFARSHRENASEYTTLHFKAVDSPLVQPDYRDKLVREWGEGSNVVRVRADGDFPLADDNVLIGFETAEAARLQIADPMSARSPILLGIDPARFGSDRTCFVRRQGTHIQDIKVYSKLDNVEVAAHVMDYCNRNHVDDIFVDENGLGAGPLDILKHNNMPVTGVMTAEVAPERKRDTITSIPHRLRDYLYLEMAKWFQHDNPSMEGVPDDYAKCLVAECCCLQYKFSASAGLLEVESKEQMKQRLKPHGRSPDMADALALTFAPNRGNIWARL